MSFGGSQRCFVFFLPSSPLVLPYRLNNPSGRLRLRPFLALPFIPQFPGAGLFFCNLFVYLGYLPGTWPTKPPFFFLRSFRPIFCHPSALGATKATVSSEYRFLFFVPRCLSISSTPFSLLPFVRWLDLGPLFTDIVLSRQPESAHVYTACFKLQNFFAQTFTKLYSLSFRQPSSVPEPLARAPSFLFPPEQVKTHTCGCDHSTSKCG